ncbi:tight adherence protein B [Inquilinus ginsengisoli]|uniref:type II secretion system F family protein n=1 Tax=Inquilinus ginsengisoli TaxID=363840 RepID=UPI003D1CF39D
MTGLGFLLLGVLALFIMAGVSLLAGRAQRRRQQHVQERLQALRDNMPKAAGVARSAVTALPGPQFLRLWLTRADIAPTPRSLGAATLAIVLTAIAVNWLAGPWAAALTAVALTFAGIYGLWRLACRRLDAFIEGLPFFLDALRQLLVVGNSVQQGLLKAAENTSPAMQRYLQPMIRRINNGAPIPESIEWLAQRLELAELYMLAAAVETNFRYGGRMSNVLANLIQILRDRARVERELKAATAEIRFSAIVLGLMPLIAAVMISFIKPSYVMFFVETERGNRLALIAVGLQMLGTVVLRRIMRLEF